jgi:Tol biopolymer transport system component
MRAMPMRGDSRPVPILDLLPSELTSAAQISPDGRWLAYSTGASGRQEVYVRPFPASGGEWQVSNQGGGRPRWRADGKELFYTGLDRDRMMAVNVSVEGGKFQSDTPRELFRMAPPRPGVNSPYDVTPGGKRFLLMEGKSDPLEVAPLTVVTNWQAGLKK